MPEKMNTHGLTENRLIRITQAICNRAAARQPDINRQDLMSMADEAVVRALASFDPARAGNMHIVAYLNHFGSQRMRGLVRNYRLAHQHRTWSLEPWHTNSNPTPGEGLAWCEIDEFLGLFSERDRRIIDLRASGHSFRVVQRLSGMSRREMEDRLIRIREITTAWFTGRTAGPMCCAYRAARETAAV